MAYLGYYNQPMLPPVIGSVVALTMASYFWYRFEQISDSPSPIIAKIKKLHIPGRKLAGVAGAMLALYQIYAQSVGIQQNFWIALIACLGIGATIVYVISGTGGLGTLGKSLSILFVCFVLFALTIGGLKSEWNREYGPSTSARTSVSDPKYPIPKNKMVRVDGQVEQSSSVMCPGLPDDARILCLCPRPVQYSLEPLDSPASDNYATLLTLTTAIEPMYKARVFLGGVFSQSIIVYPTKEMIERDHFTALQGLMDYDKQSLIVQFTAPQRLAKLRILSSTGLRVICVNQEN